MSTQQHKFHPIYKFSSPQQVILVSAENLHFAVFRETLLSSQIFATALNIPQPHADLSTSNNEFDEHYRDALAKAIYIEASEEVLEMFISILSSAQPIGPISNLEDTFALIELCEKYEISEGVIGVLKDRLQSLMDASPWKWLELASNLDDRQMGGKALEKMGKDCFLNGDRGGNPNVTLWDRLSNLNPTWVVPVMSMAFSLPGDAKISASSSIYHGKYQDKNVQALKIAEKWNERCRRFGRGEI
ncbi:uncharacterized protein L199_000708 [Kwoniella botswanensis]|uniref:uncharacterized protein n=1 Tax=Kwoniella botswanensis TaxID=1268659 RepID=UPI00315C9151